MNVDLSTADLSLLVNVLDAFADNMIGTERAAQVEELADRLAEALAEAAA